MGNISGTATILKDFEHVMDGAFSKGDRNSMLKQNDEEKSSIADQSSSDSSLDPKEKQLDRMHYSLYVVVILLLIGGIISGIIAALHSNWISTSGKNLKMITVKIPMTEHEIHSEMSMTLVMALYKACLKLEINFFSLKNGKQLSKMPVHIDACYDKGHIPADMDMMELIKMMIDFVYVLVGLIIGVIHAFVTICFLVCKLKKYCNNCCCGKLRSVLINSIISLVFACVAVGVAFSELHADGDFIVNMVSLATSAEGDAKAIMEKTKEPLLAALKRNMVQGPGFDFAVLSAVFLVMAFLFILILALYERRLRSKRKNGEDVLMKEYKMNGNAGGECV